jgi:hypothetical protein
VQPEQERECLRKAQAEAVMPLIGPLLDAWECSSESDRDEHPELDKQLRKINRAMEDATPPAAQRQPLTEEEIMQTWEGVIKYAPGEVRLKDFARAIEAAHGIGEKT